MNDSGMCTTLRGVQVLDSVSVIGEFVTKMTDEVRDAWSEIPVDDAQELSPGIYQAAAEFRDCSSRFRETVRGKIESFKSAERRLTRLQDACTRLQILGKAAADAPCTDSEEGMKAVLALEAFVRNTQATANITEARQERDKELRDIKALMQASSLHRFMFCVPTCPICMQEQADQMLPCGHTYCQACVEDIARQSYTPSIGNRNGNSQITCGMCRAVCGVAQVRRIFTN